jgi:hypothetical protein
VGMSEGNYVGGQSLQVQNWLRTVSRSRLWINRNEPSDSDTDIISILYIYLHNIIIDCFIAFKVVLFHHSFSF